MHGPHNQLPVHALIAPSLCSKILLGLPWLAHNKIVIDHSLHTAIDKSCDFDILNKSTTPHVHKHIMISAKKRREEILCLCKTLLAEL
jgi:hypothetical protein